MRLIFIADEIPKRLQRVIEFLNTQFDPCEVLGIEIRQYTAENGMRMVAPRVIGQIAIKVRPPKIKWTRETYLAEMAKSQPKREINMIEKNSDIGRGEKTAYQVRRREHRRVILSSP